MTKLIFLIIAFFALNHNLKAQYNIPPNVCGKYIDLYYWDTIPQGSVGYWIDSTDNVLNYWQVIDQQLGNDYYAVAEIENFGQDAFAFVIYDGVNYDTTFWQTTVFEDYPVIDACPTCYRITDTVLNNVNGLGHTVHIGSARVDTVCLYDSNTPYILNPYYNKWQPSWSKSMNGINFANGIIPTHDVSEIPNDTVYVNIFNSKINNPIGDFYVLVFSVEQPPYG